MCGQCLGPDDDVHQHVFSVDGSTLDSAESDLSNVMTMTTNNIARIERVCDLTNAYLMLDHQWRIDHNEDARKRRDQILAQLNALISSPTSMSAWMSTTDPV